MAYTEIVAEFEVCEKRREAWVKERMAEIEARDGAKNRVREGCCGFGIFLALGGILLATGDRDLIYRVGSLFLLPVSMVILGVLVEHSGRPRRTRW